MENKKGSGIFLGVVSVATLIVAIIGATFAFFSASITGDNTVNLTAYEFNASLSISPVYPTASASLVPMDPNGTVTGGNPTNTTNLLYAMNEATNRCIDSNNFQVCAVYRAIFTNNGSGSVTLAGTLTTTKNDPGSVKDASGFVNLKFNHLSGAENSLALDGTPIDVPSSLNAPTSIDRKSVV